MAYVTTYVCDFRDVTGPCKTLATFACAICEKHGCADHLRHALRVVFAVCETTLPMPDLPLPPIKPTAMAVPVLTFEQFERLGKDRKIAILDTDRRALTERVICESCRAAIKNEDLDVQEAMRTAGHAFVDCVRASLAAAVMAAKKGEEAA